MKSDSAKLVVFLWLAISLYFLYEIWVDVKWIADMLHAYMSTMVQHLRK